MQFCQQLFCEARASSLKGSKVDEPMEMERRASTSEILMIVISKGPRTQTIGFLGPNTIMRMVFGP